MRRDCIQEASLAATDTASTSQASEGDSLGSSGDQGSVQILVANPDEPAVLSKFMEVKNSGLSSIGAAKHREMACKPCRFQCNYHKDVRTRSPCQNLVFCGFCHDDHDQDYIKRKFNESKYFCKKAKQNKKQQEASEISESQERQSAVDERRGSNSMVAL
eukprot:gb/GFBE01077996.1/.p1 GENE.gb/GFBE01077996.1/~~gb/GFBE01077996.1/.p1  ORF type:complete len:160 (+),score=35.87 gb/GFBE01077996.1/:1-480(+)